jgi:sugar O-acyltransferase (sialic acid O-acetyltransferase NeuD family)
MLKSNVAVVSSGGMAREVAWLISQCNNANPSRYNFCCFIDDNIDNQGKILNNYPIYSFEQAKKEFTDLNVVVAFGDPKVREKYVNLCKNLSLGFDSVIHPRIEISEFISFGAGVVICSGNILTTNISLGNFIQINLNCTIAHDVILGDYSTLAPGVHVSGWVHIGKRVYIGTGANIINGTWKDPLIIGDDAIIGAGACVTKSLEGGKTYLGIPAKLINK